MLQRQRLQLHEPQPHAGARSLRGVRQQVFLEIVERRAIQAQMEF